MKYPEIASVPAVLILLASCSLSASAEHLSVVQIESGLQSNIEEAHFAVIGDLRLFNQIYSEIHSNEIPEPDAPIIDFDTHIAMFAFLGFRSTAGYRVSFDEKARLAGDLVYIRVIHDAPSSTALLPSVVTTPYAMAILPRASYVNVSFLSTTNEELERVAVL